MNAGVMVALARVTYRFNGQQVAVREGVTLTFVHGDHLGSASLTTNINGTKLSELRYKPFGEVRWSNGTMPTDRTFTGQRVENPGSVGSLMDYGARFYSPILGRFISADSIVPQPGSPQSLNRYSYARNSPLVRVDPSGHADCAAGDSACWTNEWMWKNRWYEAHGSFWQSDKQNYQFELGKARFSDIDILDQLFSEANIAWQSGDKNWSEDELYLIGQGIADIAHAVGGGTARLAKLLGSQVTTLIRSHTSILETGACVCDWWLGNTHTIWFYDRFFTEATTKPNYVRGVAVHEIGHVIGFSYLSGKTGEIPHIKDLTPYAEEGFFKGLEYFAEAFAGWVYAGKVDETTGTEEEDIYFASINRIRSTTYPRILRDYFGYNLVGK